MTTTLNPNAPSFMPSLDTLEHCHPCSPTATGFVMLADGEHMPVSDADVFDERLFPLSQGDLAELEAVDAWNQMLAELDLLEHEDALLRRLAHCLERSVAPPPAPRATGVGAAGLAQRSPRRGHAADGRRQHVRKQRVVQQPR